MAAPMTPFAETLDRCTPLFFALGETARQQILLLLAEHEMLNVNAMAELLPLSRPAISHHLKVLRLAGLVDVKSVGTENRYSLATGDAICLLEKFVAEARRCS